MSLLLNMLSRFVIALLPRSKHLLISWQHIKKQRLLTKVRLAKAVGFPVVMYGCESWTIRKLSVEDLMILNYGVGEDSGESTGLQGDQTSQL